ncbi:MAG: Gfo/Idh/MocA family oxidoreductase [Balneolaceae bacterium]|nr:Gfo/Idh/MocA family oxidoreductase [Balneolaceae bacterium]MCH8549925.1 Gfo/Idh/MocA family oxidoreductase [Balneolaceae bacterium]
MINAAIAGFGKSGKNIHAPLIKATEGIELHSLVKRSGPDLIDGYRDLKRFRDYKSMLKDDQVNLVVITTPNHLHFSMASEALASGKHVVVDKPFAVTHAEAEKLIRIAKKEERILTVFQNRRLDADFLTVQKVIKEGSIGRLVEFESRFDRFRSELREDAWKEKDLPGSGILYDLAPHLIDQALQLFGKPESLFADISAQREGDADDRFEIRLSYSGFTVKLSAGMLIPEATPRFVVRGMNGSFVKYGMDPQEESLASGSDLNSLKFGVEEAERYGELITVESGKVIRKKVPSQKGEYGEFYNNLNAAIRGEKQIMVKPEEAAEVIRLIELARQSHREGCRLEC